jgi:ABC-type arginine transport system ATPase subunit
MPIDAPKKERLTMRRHARFCPSWTLVAIGLLAACGWRSGVANELRIGTAVASITTDQPIALQGQMHTRIGSTVDAPLEVSVVALESTEGANSLDRVIMVSCDVCYTPMTIVQQVREQLQRLLPDFDTQKLLLSSTHTHTGPVFEDGMYNIPSAGVMQPSKYAEFFAKRVAEAAAEAWQRRAPGAVSWGLGHAVVGHNRRAVYADGTAKMYGDTTVPEFRGIEGYEDHTVETLFFWDKEGKLVATAVNFACTAQEVEGKSTVDADFVHPMRVALRAKYGEQLAVLAWVGAAGDQSPHLMFRQRAEDRMRELRKLSRTEEIGRRLVQAVEEALDGARQDLRTDVPMIHQVELLKLPARMVTEQELAEAQARVAELAKDPAQQRIMLWHQAVVDRYHGQQPSDTQDSEVHVLRIGDVAVCTNPFELFLDFGIQMKARSPAIQTFVVQLVHGAGYLPTVDAVRGGGYSAIVQSSEVGPEGGQVLADKSVELIQSLWPKAP